MLLTVVQILSKYNKLYKRHHIPLEESENADEHILSPRNMSKLAKYCLNFYYSTIQNDNKHNSHLITPGKFYMRIKIHKPQKCGRPIISSMNTCTYNISKYLDITLQPLMKMLPSYIQDSTQLIIELEHTTQLPEGCCLLGADVESLYPSIDIADGLLMLRRALTTHSRTHNNSFTESDIEFILELAHWVLHNNYFEFGKHNFYRQTKGTAMGTPFAVTFACLYMGQLEIEAFKIYYTHDNTINTCHKYRRFIDDIFAIFTSITLAQLFMTIFNQLRTGINLTTTHIGNTVDFLDATVYKGTRFTTTKQLDTSIFQKPFNKYLYVPPTSFHADTTHKTLVQSELKRYRIMCTDDSKFNTITSEFRTRLSQRGFLDSNLDTYFNITLDRQQLLTNYIQQKQNNTTDTTTKTAPLIFKTYNTQRQHRINLNKCLRPDESVWCDPNSNTIFGKTNILISHKRTHNLKDLLTKSKYNHPLQQPTSWNISRRSTSPLTMSLN